MKLLSLIGVPMLAFVLASCGAPRDVADEHGHGESEQGHEDGEHEAVTRTTIPLKVATKSGIRVEAVGPGVIADEHQVQGLLMPIEGRVAKVMARFPGPIRALRANIGDTVRAGQPLATIESNASLTNYTVAAPISGVVLDRPASLGAVANEGAALFEIADLSELWVDLHVFGNDAQHIRPGAPVTVTRMSDGVTAETTIERVLPSTASASQSTVARATIANNDKSWRPGSAVTARVMVERQSADLVVPVSALQTSGEADVVYVREGDVYTTRPVRVGRRDSQRAEIVSGLKRGEAVVVEQSFLVKADIEKSTAAHED